MNVVKITTKQLFFRRILTSLERTTQPMENTVKRQGKFNTREMEVIKVLAAIHRRILAASSQKANKKTNKK